MGENSKLVPSCAGVHSRMMEPCGTYTKPNRDVGAAGVCAKAVAAGTMLSSSGSATVMPRPRSTVRRGMAFFVIIMTLLSSAETRDS